MPYVFFGCKSGRRSTDLGSITEPNDWNNGAQARKSDEPFHGKIELLTPHEQHLSLSASAIPSSSHSSSSKNPGVIIVFHDITEIHRLENMRRDFVANVSHELKTPLASIQAFAETLIDGAIHDDDNNMLFLTRIVEQSDRLNLLIQDLLMN